MLALFHGESEQTSSDGAVRTCCVVFTKAKQVRPDVIRILVVETTKSSARTCVFCSRRSPTFL